MPNKEVLRIGAEIDLLFDGDPIVPSRVFDYIRSFDGISRNILLKRKIARSRIEHAVKHGTDRDSRTKLRKFEEPIMSKHGLDLSAVTDVTYVTPMLPDDEDIRDADVLLIYAPENLQRISNDDDPNAVPYGFHMFIDPDLKKNSLLAVVGVDIGSEADALPIGELLAARRRDQ